MTELQLEVSPYTPHQIVEANLTDNYCFQLVFIEKKVLLPVLEELTGLTINQLVFAEADYHIYGRKEGRSIICDILAVDDEGRVFDVEMQNYSDEDLLRRSRSYGSLIDNYFFIKRKSNKELYAVLHKKGFKRLTDVYSIWLCNSYQPGFSESYETILSYGVNGKKIYEDGSYRIFYDIRKYDGDNPKLIELFRYLRTSSEEVAENCEWKHIRQIQKKFEEVKEIEGKEGNYMACDKALEDARYYSKIEGKKEGKIEGKIEDIKNIMRNLQISVEKTLSIIGVPESEWNMYIDRISVVDTKKIA